MTFHFLDSVEDIIAILHFLRGAALECLFAPRADDASQSKTARYVES